MIHMASKDQSNKDMNIIRNEHSRALQFDNISCFPRYHSSEPELFIQFLLQVPAEKNTVRIDTWSNLKKEYIYIYIYEYINKSKRCTCLVACKQNTSTGIPSYIFILFIPLKFSPNHQIVKEVSFPKQRIDVKLRKDSCSPSIPYAPYTFHMANSCSTLSF